MALKRNFSRRSPEEIEKEVKRLTNQAVQDIQKYSRNPKDVLEMLDFMGRFYQYSLHNQLLIQSQFKGATAVGSFSFFKEKGFSVRKGEKGIKILRPQTTHFFKDEEGKWKSLRKATEEEKQKIRQKQLETKEILVFSSTTVFDLSQTTAKPEDYPKLFPNRVRHFEAEDKEVALLLKKALYEFAKKNDIGVKEAQIQSTAGGYYTPDTHDIVINSRNTELQKIATLIHELGHATMHNDKVVATKAETLLDKPTKEFQVEMVSYVVAKTYGIDTSEKAIPYIATWTENGAGLKEKEAALKEVHKEAKSFISFVDEYIGKELEALSVEKEVNHLQEAFQQVGVSPDGFLKEPVIAIRDREIHEKEFFKKGDVLTLSDMNKKSEAFNREVAQKQKEAEQKGIYYPYTKVFCDVYVRPNEKLAEVRFDLDGDSQKFSEHLRREVPRRELISILEKRNIKNKDVQVEKDNGMEM